MCGIVGYVGEKKCAPILIDGLLKLEYRGYDSAGIAVLNQDKISVFKDKGRVSNLFNLEGIDNLEGNIGIAHTRWATHGIPSKENSHPHLDNSKIFAVVHNGIIENYSDLKAFLNAEGYIFYSQTDTEVIPNLIHYYFSKDTNNDDFKFLRAVNSACKKLQGSYAIEVICKYFSDCEIVVRKDSPLVLGKGINENFIASDIPAILNYTKDFYLLDNNDIAIVKKNNIEFYNNNLEKVNKEIKTIEWDAESSEKNGYEDFMLKEIYEQPTAIRKNINSSIELGRKCKIEGLEFSKEYLEKIDKIYILACGTAMHAGLVGKTIIEKLCKIPVTTCIASEFRYQDPLIDQNTLCIFISQSGETADTIAALKLAKTKNSKTIAITNVVGSSITFEADYSIYTKAGPEIAVASTKAYTSQIVLLSILAIYFAETLSSSQIDVIEHLKNDILDLPVKIENILNDTTCIKSFAEKVFNEKDMFFLGRGTDYNVALEGSLKLKEISYIHSEAYAAGELKHGPIALIEKGITVIGILTDEKLVEKSISNIQEVITRGAKTLIITNQNIPSSNFDLVINIPNTSALISPVLSIVPLQLFSYYISKYKGLDVDKPRNLAKSVTVE